MVNEKKLIELALGTRSNKQVKEELKKQIFDETKELFLKMDDAQLRMTVFALWLRVNKLQFQEVMPHAG